MNGRPLPYVHVPPTVSVVVVAQPFHDHLAASVHSVLAQDFPPDRLEILVVDIGEGERTADVLTGFGDRVRHVVHTGSTTGAIDRGLGEAQGELLALQSGDDLWTPDKLRRQLGLLQGRPEVGLVFGDMMLIGDDDSPRRASWWEAAAVTPQRGQPLGALMRGNFAPAGTIVVRAELRDRFQPLPEWPGCEAWWIAARVAEVAELDYVRDPVLRFRCGARSLEVAPDGAIVERDTLHELPMRRWLLVNLRSGSISVLDLLAGCERYEHDVLDAARRRGLPPELVAPTGDEEAARASHWVVLGTTALESGDLGAAARAGARALGYDMHSSAVHELLAYVRQAVASAQLREDRARGDGLALRLRSFVTLALADELIARPDLLRSYGATFGAADDASLLMVLSDGLPTQVGRLVNSLVRAGLDTVSGPDLVALTVAGDVGVPTALIARAAALLSPHEQTGPLGDLPRVDAESVAQLRQWMDRGAST